jgi:CubicO group peptidase (beta-lactamase class C family)
MKKLLFFFCVCIPAINFAQNLPTATPESVGISSSRLKRIDAVLNDYIEKGRIAGAVALVVRDGKVVYNQAFGYDNVGTKTKLSKDAIVRIASQTKAITSTAVMMLYEEGKFLLDEPISKYIPALKSPLVLDKFNETDSSFTTVPAKREITIRDLLTHTSGISYNGIGTKEANAIYAKNKISNGIGDPNAKLPEFVANVAKMPLMHQPGERFTYGLNTDILGYFVEIVSGKPLDMFFQERIFIPLGMNDTYFYLPETKYNRLATLYAEDKDRKMVLAADAVQNYPKQKGSFFAGGAGLVSTATDYAKFLQCLLNGGSLNGKDILSPAIVHQMTSNQVGDVNVGVRKFGLGFALATAKEAARLPVSEGNFEWGGIFGTSYWVDPEEKLIGIVLTQKYPNSFGDLNEKYRVLVYQSLTKLNK